MMVRLFSRDAVAKSPCTCGSLPGIYINKAYAIQATTEIAENLPFWKKKYKEWGREEFKTYLTELLAAKESFQYNTWNTALLRALIENIDIVVSEE